MSEHVPHGGSHTGGEHPGGHAEEHPVEPEHGSESEERGREDESEEFSHDGSSESETSGTSEGDSGADGKHGSHDTFDPAASGHRDAPPPPPDPSRNGGTDAHDARGADGHGADTGDGAGSQDAAPDPVAQATLPLDDLARSDVGGLAAAAGPNTTRNRVDQKLAPMTPTETWNWAKTWAQKEMRSNGDDQLASAVDKLLDQGLSKTLKNWEKLTAARTPDGARILAADARIADTLAGYEQQLAYLSDNAHVKLASGGSLDVMRLALRSIAGKVSATTKRLDQVGVLGPRAGA